MTDDVDTLVFGALVIIKKFVVYFFLGLIARVLTRLCSSPSMKLSGNKSNPALNSEGKASKSHVMVYTAEAIRTHPEVRLTRGGLILIALLAGGDYDKVRMLHFKKKFHNNPGF
jgi:Holliday junction resolvase YEN1